MNKKIIILLIAFAILLNTVNATAPTINSCTIDTNTTTKYVIKDNARILWTSTGTVSTREFSLYNTDNSIERIGGVDGNFILNDNFTDNDYTNNPTWTVTPSGIGSFDASGGSLTKTGASGTPTATTPIILDANYLFYLTVDLQTLTAGDEINIGLNTTAGEPSNVGNGYVFNYVKNSGIQLARVDAGVPTVILTYSGGALDTGVHNITLRRDINGLWTLGKDGTNLGVATSTTYTLFRFLDMSMASAAGSNMDNIKINVYNNDTNSYQLKNSDFLDNFTYACRFCNGLECTTSGPTNWTADIDKNIDVHVINSQTGLTLNDYTTTFSDGSLQSFVNKRWYNLSEFLTRTNTNGLNPRLLEHTITGYDNNTLSIFPPKAITTNLTEDTNVYDINMTTASWSFGFYNPGTYDDCWTLWYAGEDNDFGNQIITGAYQNGCNNIPSQVQANIPSGLTTIDFGKPLTGDSNHPQTVQWFNNQTDTNNIDFNVLVYQNLNNVAEIIVKDKQQNPVKDAKIEVYGISSTNSSFILYDLEYTGERDDQGTVLFPIDNNGTIRIVISKEGYETQTKNIQTAPYNGTGTPINITLFTATETSNLYKIIVKPVNPLIFISGTEASVTVDIDNAMIVCYQETHNTDSNIITSATQPSNTETLTSNFNVPLTETNIDYKIKVFIDTDGDTNCLNNPINTFTWRLSNEADNPPFEEINELDTTEQSVLEWFAILAIIIIGIIGGAIIGKGLPLFFITIIIFTIWQLTTYQTTNLLIPTFLAILYILKDPLQNAMGVNR